MRINKQETDYEHWIQQKRGWFKQNFPWTFQLKDDLLDIYGETDKFGKQVGGDIISNKKTLIPPACLVIE